VVVSLPPESLRDKLHVVRSNSLRSSTCSMAIIHLPSYCTPEPIFC